MNRGDTSNNSVLTFPSHLGTHIDFPFHFLADGQTADNYEADYFIHRHVGLAHIEVLPEELLIGPQAFEDHPFDPLTTFFIINTGYWRKREQEDYWSRNPGLSPELSVFFREKMPNLRMVGFDSISLSSYQHRDVGRDAHMNFLSDPSVLIVEDMDLSQLTKGQHLKEIIVSPLRFDGADGSPVTIFARLEE